VDVDPGHLAAFGWLADELRAWNERFNLTTITEMEDVLIKHVLDSLTLVPTLDRLYGDPTSGQASLRLVDVGTGAGFPGVPVRLVRPKIEAVLVEAAHKKAAFVQHVVDGLGLRGATVARQRAEEFGREPDRREAFDVAVGRAVAGMATLAELLLPLVRVGGHAILMKTRAALDTELVEAASVWETLGAGQPKETEVGIPGLLDDRVLVVVQKLDPIPERYPRRPGIPQRRPLGAKRQT
jgi:16S rRNA (guanine527-N7)-methyltransferase